MASSMHVYWHPACFAHDTGPGHPESPARLRAVVNALRAGFPNLTWLEAPVASYQVLQRVHSDGLIDRITNTMPAVIEHLDADTLLSSGSAQAALRAAGAVVAAVDAVMYRRSRRAFCAVRPPGHHATTDTAMGFCLLNSVAVAAAHAIAEHGLDRVAIIDFDVHHGNGTQDIFYRNKRVHYYSSHQAMLYPHTGRSEETGVGNCVNVPIPAGSDGSVFRQAWSQQLLPRLDAFAPQLVLISAGFDAHHLDPLADLQLQADDYHWISSELCQIADKHAAGRLVSSLEGGYSLGGLADSVTAHVQALIG